MTDYIEREAALNNLAKSYFAEVLDDLIHAEDAVNAVPAADVRPVVLCRDCEYWQSDLRGSLISGAKLCRSGFP